MSNVFVIKTGSNIEESLDLLLDKLGGLSHFVRQGDKVVIKPNFVAPFPNAVTSIDLLISLVNKINAIGAIPVVAESSGYEFNTDITFQLLDLYNLSKKYKFQLLNPEEDEYVTKETESFPIRHLRIAKIFLDADVIINLPKMKKHSITNVTLSMKNLYGCIDKRTRSRGHALGLHECIYQVNRFIKPHLIIMDGLTGMDRAVFSKSERRNLLLAGTDNPSVDKVACLALGVNPSQIDHIQKMLIDYSSTITPIFLNEVEGFPLQKRAVRRLSFIRKIAYKIIYIIESLLLKLNIQIPLIQNFHWYFGIRPYLNGNYCDDCKVCLDICPVDAINLENKKIVKEKCMYVRCLKCRDVCPKHAIDLKGSRKNDQ